MKHDMSLGLMADAHAPHAVSGCAVPTRLLSELEARCALLKARPADHRLMPLFERLDSFTLLAADLRDGLLTPAALTPALRRAFDAEFHALETAFAVIDDGIEPLSARIPADARFDREAMAAVDMLCSVAALRTDARDLHLQLSSQVRALLYPGAIDPFEIRLIDAGFADPISSARRFHEWQDGVPLSMRRTSERRAMAKIMPALIEGLERFDDPDAAVRMLDEIVCRLPAGVPFFEALSARPSLLTSLLGLIGHAPALARNLIAQPALVERLIDSRAYAPLPPAADLDAEFKLLLSGADRAAGTVRVANAVNAYRFGIGLQLLEASADALDIAQDNTHVAEAALRALADDVLARMAMVHGKVPGCELAIVALGRFGGSALTTGSDLDLIYLFTGDHRAHSDGRKPLDANEYFSRVAQQITMAMTTATTLGPLYQIDTRLRPWGAKGMLACSTQTFSRYHFENAWTWEHMALTRARTVYGSSKACDEVKELVGERLRQPRNRASLLLDAMKMRGDISRHKPAQGPFDIKLMPGGLVDLEFSVHVNQLDHHVGLHPKLRAAVRSQVGAGLMDPAVVPAHDLLTRLLIVLRLLSPHAHEPAPGRRLIIAQACGLPDWDSLTAAYAEARTAVQRAWRDALSTPTPGSS